MSNWLQILATVCAAIAAVSAAYQSFLTRAALDSHVDTKTLEVCIDFADAVSRALQHNQDDGVSFPASVYQQFGIAFGRVSMLATFRGEPVPAEVTQRYLAITDEGPTDENLSKMLSDIGLVESYCEARN